MGMMLVKDILDRTTDRIFIKGSIITSDDHGLCELPANKFYDEMDEKAQLTFRYAKVSGLCIKRDNPYTRPYITVVL